VRISAALGFLHSCVPGWAGGLKILSSQKSMRGEVVCGLKMQEELEHGFVW
jgi:hypothetical protein